MSDFDPDYWGRRIVQAARHQNLKPPEAIDELRVIRAKEFAAKIMQIVEPYCHNKYAALSALIAAAYVADAEIVPRN
jgi:predicted negative regulator of RcsB-dependent stress response